MQAMIQIEDKIVSTDLLTEKFCCDVSRCRGICCVEGNAGAPLEIEEADILEREFDAYRRYMKPEGIAAVQEQGFAVVDGDGDLTTPLISEAECAYSFEQNGITMCAIEKAHREGKTPFIKPVSCHLYPIRVAVFGNGTVGLNYHRWNVCEAARSFGRKTGIPVYRSLREPIVRRFGKAFFGALEEAEQLLEKEAESRQRRQ